MKIVVTLREKLYTERQRVQDTLEEKLCAIGCDSGNVEVQWNIIKECVLDTSSDLVGKVEKRARKPWITQEMISKMDERRKWKNVNTEEGRKKNDGAAVRAVRTIQYNNLLFCLLLTYLLTPWSRVLLEKLTSKLCS